MKSVSSDFMTVLLESMTSHLLVQNQVKPEKNLIPVLKIKVKE